jgi:two-component system, OmpR family, copper resistance phosphate regulon response regulator CusR
VKVLVVEDEVQMRDVLRGGLREHGFDVVAVGTAREGLDRGLHGAWTVLVLDVNLQDEDGFTLCRRLRAANVTTPILMLTARDAVDDRVTGLEAGADDYLVKPFALKELAARVWALARRPPVLADPTLRIADLEVNVRTREVRRAGTAIELTAKEFALLEFFARNRGAVLDRAAITAYVWDDNHDPFTNALEVLVRRLRAKIDDPFPLKLVHTVRGAGYRFGP